MRSTFKRTLSIGVAALVVVTSCGGGDGDEPLEPDEAISTLNDLVDDIGERLENWVAVTGSVKRPGRYEFRSGMMVADLLQAA